MAGNKSVKNLYHLYQLYNYVPTENGEVLLKL